MFKRIINFLNNENIERIGILDIKECDVINQRLLPHNANSAIMFCIPYRTNTALSNDGFSEYARTYDYHRYAQELFKRLYGLFECEADIDLYGFCDHSPINEKIAAAKCGLGVIGKNSLFIDDVYGSFVFIGTILTNLEFDKPAHKVKTCNNCGLCEIACPNHAITQNGFNRLLCLSGISQKKKKTPDEIKLLKDNNIVWGCDVCQLICPHNTTAKISPIIYFSNNRISHIDKETILSMTDEEFEKFPFAYKGKNLILNNIDFV